MTCDVCYSQVMLYLCTGLVDILSMSKTTWIRSDGKIHQSILTEKDDGTAWEIAMKARTNLIDKLTEYSDNLANTVISANSLENVQTADVAKALREVTLQHVRQFIRNYFIILLPVYFKKAVPVLCGSSYKNIGVQPLMDAVILYLPSPLDVNQQFKIFENSLCARAFKVIHDKQKGPLVFFRIYSGQFIKGQKIYNIGRDQSEQIGRLYVAYADDFLEVDTITSGNIAVVTGLKVRNFSKLLLWQV